MSDDLIARLRARAWHEKLCDEAADAIAAERARAERAESALVDADALAHRLLADVNELSARADAAERDAERYRWLRDNRVGYAMHMGAVLYTPELVVPRGMSDDSTDAAIDAARKENPHD